MICHNGTRHSYIHTSALLKLSSHRAQFFYRTRVLLPMFQRFHLRT
ncbi:hypothetical protein FOMG_18791 [Fusarium oxysporum f. sp. melonis 26406]|uniref:Uncharacterized protein n=1 Tax=Fusarium oxysporum f. sp. melonis 26406 TaxID=1089452 RepID=W9ZTV0_FUSOX|nr:hypothetical protein FOMG_18791 [Fusarium oxysporum f. sp. melonis 26406]